MTALAVAIALVIGIFSAEVLVRGLRQDAWPARRFAVMRRELGLFHVADNDDARQAHLIGGGMATLTLSLAVLAAIAVVAAVFAAPMVLLGWDTTQVTIYSVVSFVAAIAWWMVRRRPRAT